MTGSQGLRSELATPAADVRGVLHTNPSSSLSLSERWGNRKRDLSLFFFFDVWMILPPLTLFLQASDLTSSQ